MTVSTLQQFLRSLAVPLRNTDGGEQAARELEGGCLALEPFQALEITAFAAFLARCDEFQQSGAVPPPTKFDLSSLQEALSRIDLAEAHVGQSAAADAELAAAQEQLIKGIAKLSDAVGLKGALKTDPKWADKRGLELRARRHCEALRQLATRIPDPAAFETLEINEKMESLAKEPTAAEWKLIAAEFSLPPSLKGDKGVEEVLFKLTGYRRIKAKPTRARKTTELDQAKIGTHADRLRGLLERAKSESQIPETEVSDAMNEFETLNKQELAETAKRAGIEKPAASKKDILTQIESRLSAGKRVLEQTAQ